MLYEGVAEQSTGRSLGIAPGHCNGTCLTISASRRRDLMGAEPPWPRSELCASLALCCCHSGWVLAPDELRSVYPNSMEHRGQFPRQRHFRSPHAPPLGDIHCPALKRAETWLPVTAARWLHRARPFARLRRPLA